MNDNPHQPDEPKASATPGAATTVRYERRDVRWRPITAFGVGLVALLVVAVWAMASLHGYLAGPAWRGVDPAHTTGAIPILRQREELQQKEDRLLSEYAWVDRQRRIVRIPIQRAMQLVVEQAQETSHDSNE